MLTYFYCYSFGLFLLTAAGGGMVNQQAAKGPISEEELLALVTTSKMGAVPAKRVVELIKIRGLGFKVKEILLLELHAREANNAIIDALKEQLQRQEVTPKLLLSAESESLLPEAPATLWDAANSFQDKEMWLQFLEAARGKAMEYTDNLPNFICTQITQRFRRHLPKKGWVRVDNFVAELTYYDKKEHYRLLSVANRIARIDATLKSLRGTTSTGEFGSSLRFLFDPATKTIFRLEGMDKTNGSPTVRVGFRVSKITSNRAIIFWDDQEEQTVITPYRGRCWIDPVSLQVVRIQERAFRIPNTFPVSRSEGSTDYDLVSIGGSKHWLPVRAEVLLENRLPRVHSKNVIEFKRYRKFGSDVKILPD